MRPSRRFRERRPKPTGWHRWTRLGLEVLLGIVAGLVILAGFLAWRLSEGPIPLSFLTPRIEAALQQDEGSVSIEETFLVWDAARSSLDLRVRGLALSDGEGEQSLYLPESNLSFSIRDLFLGRLMVTGLEVLGAEVHLLRLEDGGFVLRGAPDGAGAGGAPAESSPSGDLLQALLGDDESGALAQLQEIRLLDTLVTLEDRQQGQFWQAPAREILLARDARGLVGEATLDLELDGEATAVQLVFAYGERRGLLDLAAEVQRLPVPKLALLVPELAPLAALQSEASGSINATLAPGSDLTLIDFDLALGPGVLGLPDAAEPLALRGGQVTGLYDGGAGSLVLDRLELSAGTAVAPGPRLVMAATLEPAGEGQRLAIELSLDTIEVKTLLSLWPTDLLPGARHWLSAQAQQGTFRDVAAESVLLLSRDAAETVGVQSARTSLSLSPRPHGTEGATFTLAAALASEPTGQELAVTLQATPLGLEDLLSLWPPAASPGGLAWVQEHVQAARVENLSTEVSLRLPTDSRDWELLSLDGAFSVRDAEMDYYPPLPAVSDFAVEGTFDEEGLSFRSGETAIGDLAMQQIAVRIYDLAEELQRMTIEGSGSGSLPILLAMLDQPPFGLVRPLGIVPNQTEGRADFALTLDLPLLDEVTLADLEFGAGGTLYDVRLRGFVAGEDVTAERLSLSLDPSGMEVGGDVVVAGSPMALTWRESGGRSTVTAESDALAAETAAKLVPALAGSMSGTLAGRLELAGRPAGKATVRGSFDLGATVVELPALGWQKPAGTAGSLSFAAALDAGRLVALDDLQLDAPGLLASGGMTFGAEGELLQATFQRLETDGQVLRDLVARPLLVEGERGWQVTLGGGIVDLRPWIDRLEMGREGEGGPPLEIEASYLERVILPGGSLEGVSLAVARDRLGLARLVLAGELRSATGGGGPLLLSLAPDERGHRTLVIESADMGRLLAVLNIADDVVGGELSIRASAAVPGRDAPLAGTVEGSGFRLVDAPVLAQILLFASLTGIGDVLAGDGIPFERLTGDIAFSGGVLSTDLLKAYGGSLGITVQGEVDFGADELDLEGSVVPAYAINQVIGEIPLIGWVLTGGEGGGLLAVSYDVSGPVGDPQISVNPLSALTPGFLRGLFDLFEDDGSPPPPTLYPEGPGR